MTTATAAKKRSEVKDPQLAPQGKKRILWADGDMPVLARIRDRFAKEKPLAGLRMSACLHVTAETANLARTLQAGGADLVLIASNPLSTQDDVAASLVKDFGISVFAIRGEDNDTYYKHIVAALEHEPHVTMDDGADLVSAMVFVALGPARRRASAGAGLGAEAVAGRAQARHRPGRRQHGRDDHRRQPPAGDGARRRAQVPGHRRQRRPDQALLRQPLRHRPEHASTASSGRPTCCSAGRKVVVCGYGWCGKGVALRARGLGANVIVTEVDPIRALEAAMDGFSVMPMAEAAPVGDVFITVTGNAGIIRREHFAGHEGRRDGLQQRPFRRGAGLAGPARKCVEGGHANVRPARGRVPAARTAGAIYVAGPGPAGEPGRGRGPSAERHGHELRHAGAGDRVLRQATRAS